MALIRSAYDTRDTGRLFPIQKFIMAVSGNHMDEYKLLE
jgi:hypothetical protein